MCSILNASVKNWSEMDFKYLSQEIGDLPEFTNKTECINMNTWAVLKGFLIKNYLIAVIFLVLQQMNVLMKKTIDMLLMFGIRLK